MHIEIWGTGYKCADSVMGPFTDTAGNTTPLTVFDERRITYLVATNAEWLSYLVNKGIQFMHYSVNRVMRQFGLDQDIPDDFSTILESTTSIRPFLWPSAFKFSSRHFTTVTIPSSQRQGPCIAAMHRYWQVLMTSIGKFRPRLIELTSFKLKLLVRFIMNKTC